MSKEIGYWLLAHASWNPFKRTEYLCLQPSYLGLMPSMVSTKNVKLAHRFFSLDDAEAFCAHSYRQWTPVLRLFDGDELARV